MKLTALIFAAAIPVLSSGAWASKDMGECKTTSDCKAGGICLAVMDANRKQVHRCIIGEQGDYCPETTAGKGSESCDGSLVCRNVIPKVGMTLGGDYKKDYRCVGRGQVNDLCAAADAGTGSASCGGNLVCREVNKEFRCVAPASRKQNETCLKSDAGKGSIDCEGNLVCRNVSTTSPEDYRCVGRGLVDDYCAASDAHAGSASCGGKLVCRSRPEIGRASWRGRV